MSDVAREDGGCKHGSDPACCIMCEAACNAVLIDVRAERARQDRRWHEQNHPDGTGLGGDRAAADRARDACDKAASEGMLTWRHIANEEYAEAKAETNIAMLRKELVQSMAVQCAWVEHIDRRLAK